MSRVERKEYQETKIMRTVSPVRGTRGSTQNLAEFDQNLDYLLEDLQSSVSRPGSSLGNINNNTSTYRETSRNVNAYDSSSSVRSNSLNRITNLRPQNPITDYSSDDTYSYTSPDGTKNIKSYKKESYTYKTSGDGVGPEKTRMQNNINQLDSLLDNLQQVKSSTDTRSYNSTGATPTSQDQKHTSSKRTVQRELHYGDTPRSSSRGRTLERSDRESSVTRDIEYIGEGNYGDLRTVRHTSPSPSRTSTLSKQSKVTNVHSYPVEVVETTTPVINPEILANLDPNLLPTGNTKVTTTIKTYTYEIPGAGYPSQVSPIETEQYVYSPNQSQTTPSKSFVYNKVENNTLTRNVTDNAPPYQKPSPPINNDGTIIKETITTRNYQPGYSPDSYPTNKQHTYIYNETTRTNNFNNENGYPNDERPYSPDYPKDAVQRPIQGRPPHETYIIKETHNTTNTINQPYPSSGAPYPPSGAPYPSSGAPYPTSTAPYPNKSLPQNPPRQETYIIKETHNTNVIDNGYPKGQPQPIYPINNPPNTTYIYKETHNTTNTNLTPQNQPYPVGNPPSNYPPGDGPKTTIIYKDTHTTNIIDKDRPFPKDDTETFDPNYPPYPSNAGKGKPKEPINVMYKYSAHSTTTNKYKGGGYPPEGEREPLLQPKPFPINDGSGPPKKLDELMATIGNEPPNSALNAGYNQHEAELAKQRKVDTLKQQHGDLDKKEPKDLQRTKNVTGPPVYYPPGHEMFAKKEEAGAWRAEGAMARESGKYKYEAESKSKSKSSSGAAIVPVCLPLCCGLPCTIL